MNLTPTEHALAYLHDHHVMTLATHGDEGVWAAAVFYVNDGFTLYFLSAPSSRHTINLLHDPRVAVTVQEDYADWRDVKGVQAEGTVDEISGDVRTRVRELYEEKFSLAGMLTKGPLAIAKAMDKVRWYRLAPQRLYFVDNSVGFGHRDEIACADPNPPAER